MERIKPRYFENQKQAASILGLDEYELKEWKAQGCPAFRYGRIYHAELLEWIEARKLNGRPQEESEHEIRRQRDRLRLERERFEFAQRKEVMLPVEQFELGLAKTRAAFNKELTAFGGRINKQCEGLDFDERAEMLEREVNALKARLASCYWLPAD